MSYEDGAPAGYRHCFMCGRVRDSELFLGLTSKNPYASGVQPDGKRYFCDVCYGVHSIKTLKMVADSDRAEDPPIEEILITPWGVWNYAADYSGNVWGPVVVDAQDQNQVYVEAGGYRIYMYDATWYSPYGSAHFAMDNNPTTAFYSRYGSLIALKSTTGTQKIPTRFEITAGVDTNNDWATYGSITPKSYRFQATNNWIDTEDAKYYPSTNWTTLAEYNDQVLAAGEVRSFDVLDAEAYTHFRLQAGGSDHVNDWNGYASFKLFGHAP